MKSTILNMALVAICAASSITTAVAGDDGAAGCRTVRTTTIITDAGSAKAVDPIETAAEGLKLLGAERVALNSALERIRSDNQTVEQKLNSYYREHDAIVCESRSLHRLISKGCYPFCLNGTTYCNASSAVRRTSTLLARANAIKASIASLDSNLQNSQDAADQIVAEIVQKETDIALVPIKATLSMIGDLPNSSAPLLQTLDAMVPAQSPEIAAHRVRVAAFLAAPLDGESMTAEAPTAGGTIVK